MLDLQKGRSDNASGSQASHLEVLDLLLGAGLSALHNLSIPGDLSDPELQEV